jgi:hypothetical protein
VHTVAEQLTRSFIDETLDGLTYDQHQRWYVRNLPLGEDFAPEQWDAAFASFLQDEATSVSGFTRPEYLHSALATGTAVVISKSSLNRIVAAYFGVGLLLGIVGTLLVTRSRARQVTSPSPAQWW